MDIRFLENKDDIDAAARLSALNHARLRSSLPFLAERPCGHYAPKLGWMVENGSLAGIWRKGTLSAFLGGFLIDDLRNEGPGFFSPDWCHGTSSIPTAFRDYRSLYRELAPRWLDSGGRLHAVAVHSCEPEAVEAFSLSGFGKIVLDSAAPTADIQEALGEVPVPDGIGFHRASAADAKALSSLDASLASHIGASPVLMPRTHGSDSESWRSWLSQEDAIAFVAEGPAGAIGFIKAQDPQFDVSDSVHMQNALAVNGMFVSPAYRGGKIGKALLRLLAENAATIGKTLLSVDFETTNPEAHAFWTKFFKPVTWSFERRYFSASS